MAAAAPVAGQLTARRGPRVPLVASGLCIAAGLALLLGLGPGTSYAWLAVALAVLGAGLGLVNPPITNAGVSGMPPAQAGVAAAVISVTRQLGSLLGVAVMGDMVTSGVRSGMAAGQPARAALAAATHGPWALGVACGLLVALAGYLSTTARAHATAAAVEQTDNSKKPCGAGRRRLRSARGGRVRAGRRGALRYPASSASSRASSAGSKPSFSGPPRPMSQARVSRIVSVIGRQTRPAARAWEESTSLNAS